MIGVRRCVVIGVRRCVVIGEEVCSDGVRRYAGQSC